MDIVVLPGDGIGPEITEATLAVLRAADARFGLGLSFETHDVGLATLETRGTTLPEEVFSRAMAADGTILGPISSFEYPPREQGGINLSAAFRTRGELYANIRPARSRAGLPHWGRTPMDLVIVRENTEGFYADRSMYQGSGEFMPTPDMALAVRKITERACTRIARTAFEIARGRRKKVTAVHKANVMKVTDGLFLRCVRRVAEAFPEVALDDVIVDAAAALLVRDAARFDVIVTTNMFGDILTDLGSVLQGGMGMAVGCNVGDDHAMFEPIHGSAPPLAGRDLANPLAMLLATAEALLWLGRRRGDERLIKGGRAIDDAVAAIIARGKPLTTDLVGAERGAPRSVVAAAVRDEALARLA